MPAMLVAGLLMALSAVVQVVDSVIVRALSEQVHPFEILFFRNLFGLVLLTPLMRRADMALDARGLWAAHGSRAVLKIVAMASSFYAIALLPLSTFTAIAFTAPLFAMLGAILVLGEPVRASRLAALALGFAGILVVLRPSTVPVGAGAAFALLSAVGFAAVTLVLKFTSSRESTARIVWLNLLISVPLSLLLALPFWTTPSAVALGLMAAQGAGGMLAQLAVTTAMARSDASALVIVDFIRLPLSAAAGLLLFGEAIEPAVLVGGAIIVGALVLVFSERRPRAAE